MQSEVLTSRQKEVLQEMATGKGMKEIVRLFGISPKTVETHRQLLMDRLGIYHVPGLVRYALQSGIVPATCLLETGAKPDVGPDKPAT